MKWETLFLEVISSLKVEWIAGGTKNDMDRMLISINFQVHCNIIELVSISELGVIQCLLRTEIASKSATCADAQREQRILTTWASTAEQFCCARHVCLWTRAVLFLRCAVWVRVLPVCCAGWVQLRSVWENTSSLEQRKELCCLMSSSDAPLRHWWHSDVLSGCAQW